MYRKPPQKSSMVRTGGYFDEIKQIERIRREEMKTLRRKLEQLEQQERQFTGRTGPMRRPAEPHAGTR